MATSSIYHFSHKGHPLTPVESDKEFLCDGCKTPGAGKRYRCNAGCDFDLHDYCATCPPILTSFMHPRHSLTLMIHNPRQSHRVCDVCRDPVEGLFYTCRECEFDLHPVCTQLPQKLNHALHMTHPLLLQSNSSLQSFCNVCKTSCNGWRYRCSICNFDIHLECVLAPVVSRGFPVPGQGVPFQPPPQFPPYYGFQYHGPVYNPYGQYQHGDPFMYPQQNSFVQPQPQPQPQNYYYYQEGQYGTGPYMCPQQNSFVQPQPQNYYNYDQEGQYGTGPYMCPQQNSFVQPQPQPQPQNYYNNYQEGATASGSNNAGNTGRLGKFMFYLVGQLGLGVLSNLIFGAVFE